VDSGGRSLYQFSGDSHYGFFYFFYAGVRQGLIDSGLASRDNAADVGHGSALHVSSALPLPSDSHYYTDMFLLVDLKNKRLDDFSPYIQSQKTFGVFFGKYFRKKRHSGACFKNFVF
jgi:hypothetical protein